MIQRTYGSGKLSYNLCLDYVVLCMQTCSGTKVLYSTKDIVFLGLYSSLSSKEEEYVISSGRDVKIKFVESR